MLMIMRLLFSLSLTNKNSLAKVQDALFMTIVVMGQHLEVDMIFV